MYDTERQKALGGPMEKQVLNQASVWYSHGLVLLIMVIAVAGAAIRDVRLVNAAAKTTLK
jgi:hypothetical protein